MRLRGVTAIVALGALAACFSEPTVASDGGSTGEPECVVGALGCPCAPEGACEGMLACEPSVSRCIDPTCTPGALLCTCVEGSCLEGLACQAGLCRPPPSGETTDGSPTSSTPDDGGPGTSPVDDGGTTLPGGSTGSDPPADTGAATSTSTDPTGAPSDCSELGCVDCFNCVTAQGAACSNEDKICDMVEDCIPIRDCVKSCGPDPVCTQNTCCGNINWVDGHEAFNNLVDCVSMHCACLEGLLCPGG